MKIGYSYWGFLGDKKLSRDFKPLSTPDGNAFYSWSIIHDLIKNGHEVVKVMPDRDKPGYELYGDDLFSSFAKQKRSKAYTSSASITYPEDMSECTLCDVFDIWDNSGLNECDQILLEWRMLIKGRNDFDSRSKGIDWQPDYFLQCCLIQYCIVRSIALTVFDLDYKLTEMQARQLKEEVKNVRIFELGTKWKDEHPDIQAETVAIPFDFDEIYTFKPQVKTNMKLVYVGNRYERDWCIYKYIPKSDSGVVLYGDWLESNRDSIVRWPRINFKHRVTASEMPAIYQDAATTVLLAKEDYCKYHFMTARLLEAVFYGTVPLFIEEYGKDFVKKLVGSYANVLTVHSEADVSKKMNDFCKGVSARVRVVNGLREELRSTFDVSNFTAALLNKQKPKWKMTSRKTAFEHMKEDTFKPAEIWTNKYLL